MVAEVWLFLYTPAIFIYVATHQQDRRDISRVRKAAAWVVLIIMVYAAFFLPIDISMSYVLAGWGAAVTLAYEVFAAVLRGRPQKWALVSVPLGAATMLLPLQPPVARFLILAVFISTVQYAYLRPRQGGRAGA